MLNTIKVSFIVPIYNVENYIKECIDSIIEQSIDSKEIILIDDGSTDKSLDIVKKYYKKYPYVKLIIQENKGLAETRNIGIQNSSGEYIYFIDSDDYIVGDDIICKMYSMCKKYDLDLIRGKYIYLDDKTKTTFHRKLGNHNKKIYNRIISGTEYLKKTIDDDDYEVVVVLGLYKREFLIKNEVKFRKGVYYEDNEFTLKVLLNAKKMMQIDDVFYYYRLRENSITRSYSLDKAINILKNIDFMREYINSLNLDDVSIKYSYKTLSILFYQVVCAYGHLSKFDSKILKSKISNELSKEMLKLSVNKHQYKKILLYTYAPIVLRIVYKVKNINR